MMSAHTEKSTWLIFLLFCIPILGIAAEETQMEQTTINTTVTEPKNNSTKDLLASETADPKKVEIVKQIRRLNEDGSYTVGYEAGDGTFKIESRDVQGNIKGTFGYVDGDGEIKRVSYSTSNSTQSPLLSTIHPPIIQPVLRFNRTAGTTTTRRPTPTLIYPKTSSNPTRATVIQAIPRRRPISAISHAPVTTTESYRVVTGNYLPINTTEVENDAKTSKQFPIFTPRASSDSKPVQLSTSNSPINEPKIYRQPGSRVTVDTNNDTASTTPSYTRTSIVYDKTIDRAKDSSKPLRANTFRRQLSQPNYENEQMYSLQQSAGDDTTDVYGGSISIGTARPLFTTTTGRPRLVPIHTILSARQKLNEKYTTSSPQVHEDQQETTLEATTNKIDDDTYVTANPVPIIQIPISSNNLEQRVLERPFLKQYPTSVPVTQFRTREFLRDNPGAPIPIGNQRILFRYNPNIQVDENGQFLRQPPQLIPANLIPIQNQNNVQDGNAPIDGNQEHKPNIIAIPVHQTNMQNGRFPIFNPYNQGRDDNIIPQRLPPPINGLRPISAPVSTRDLKRLLHQLLIRQNRLQALMDIREDFNTPGPPYQNNGYRPQGPLFEPEYRQKSVYGPRSAIYNPQFAEGRPYNNFVRPSQYNQNTYQQQYQEQYPTQQNQYPERNDYRPQDDRYNNEISRFNPAIPYESQRYIPRRRFYRPRMFDPRYEEPTTPENNEDEVEYLPPDVREALLLKMLMLAIHPDFAAMPSEPQMAMTTPPPEYRKKVRNVQILGEETETKENQVKRNDRSMKTENVA